MNYSAFVFAILALCVGRVAATSGPECPPKKVIALPDKQDCTKFWLCINGVGHEKSCPKGLYWSDKVKLCVLPKLSGCTEEDTTTTERPTNPTKPTSTTTAPVTNPAIPCPKKYWKQAYFPDSDCTKFWQCSNGVAYQQTCPKGLNFNPKLNVCDWPKNAGCTGEGWSTTTPIPVTTTEEPCTGDEENA